jgi:hypothetical protein
MEFNLDKTVAVLERTPSVLNSLLRDLPPDWTQSNEGEGTWSAYDVIGHLIHGEKTDWMVRLRRILEYGESKPFDRFDRLAQFRESAGKSLAELLDEFAELRSKNLAELRALHLGAADFQRRGSHPVFGSVTLVEFLSTWAAHDLTHLHQIARVMAHQYREAVGPWTKFLGVLQCAGHSE